MIGGLQLFLAFFVIVSLASWRADDSSLTFANGEEPQNWLGFTGASVADLAMQFFGFGIVALLLPLLFWGALNWSGRGMASFKVKGAFALGAVVFLCAALGCIAVPAGWPLYVGLGGVVGDAVLNIPAAFAGGYPSGIWAVFLGIIFAVPAFYFLFRASQLQNGLPPKAVVIESQADPLEESYGVMEPHEEQDDHLGQWDEDEKVSVWSTLSTMVLGLLYHWAYLFAAFVRNLVGSSQRQTQFGHQPSDAIYSAESQDEFVAQETAADWDVTQEFERVEPAAVS